MINKFSILNGAKYFSLGIFLNLVFTWAKKKIIEDITKSDNNFATIFVDHNLLPDINFNGNCLM